MWLPWAHAGVQHAGEFVASYGLLKSFAGSTAVDGWPRYFGTDFSCALYSCSAAERVHWQCPEIVSYRLQFFSRNWLLLRRFGQRRTVPLQRDERHCSQLVGYSVLTDFARATLFSSLLFNLPLCSVQLPNVRRFQSRGDFIVVGDLMRSVSLLVYKAVDSAIEVREASSGDIHSRATTGTFDTITIHTDVLDC